MPPPHSQQFMNKTFNKSGAYKNFEIMHQAIDYDVKLNQANNNRSRQLHSKHSTSDENSDDDEPPPPCKRQKSGFKSVVTARCNESDNDDDGDDNDRKGLKMKMNRIMF